MGFESMWEQLAPVGRNRGTGGYERFVWTDADLTTREWFVGEAESRGLTVVEDGNGNQFAWWGEPSAAEGGRGVLTGSHLDSVPDGGAFDGPLGVVSAFMAFDRLCEQGFVPTRPLGVANFTDEEGARFGIACAGSRLLTGALDADHARGLRDRDGISLDVALRRLGRDPERLGRDYEALDRIGTYVELHVEQGKGLVDTGDAVGVATAIWPHGRWRFDFRGSANHAGTTAIEDRHDPMLTYAATVLAANRSARSAGARATFGRLRVEPNATNAIPSSVTSWLDARAGDESTLQVLVDYLTAEAVKHSRRDGTTVEVSAESESGAVSFDPILRDRMAAVIGGAPALATGAGHDAGILAAHGIATGMLFVRNPTGVSHSPEESAEIADCEAGVAALVRVLRDLAGVGA